VWCKWVGKKITKCQVITRQKQTIIKLFDEVAAASLKLGSWREIDLWGHNITFKINIFYSSFKKWLYEALVFLSQQEK